MIKLFIPSYNRPCQLKALLESIVKHDKYLFFNKIEIYYQGTTEKLNAGYEKLKNQYFGLHTEFIPKSGNHYSDVMNSMENCDYWAITTDDSIFYKKIHLTRAKLDKLMRSDVNHFSFRLGYNTTTIDYANPDEKHYLSGKEECGIVRFHWQNHVGHYGHPFAVDSFLTNADYMKQLVIKSCSSDHFNYRYFECKIGEYLRMNNNRPFALCFPESVLVNSCNNMVADAPYLKNGIVHPFTIEDLNEKWLEGYKIDINCIDKIKIDNVQMELPFEFIKE